MLQVLLFGIVFSLSSFCFHILYYYFRYADYLSGRYSQEIHTLEELGWIIAGLIYIFLLDGLMFRSRRLVNTLLMTALANLGIKLCLIYYALRVQAHGILLTEPPDPLVFQILIVLDVVTLGVSCPKPLLFRMASSRTPLLMDHLVYSILVYKNVTLWFTYFTTQFELEQIYKRMLIALLFLLVVALVNNFCSTLRYEVEQLVMRVLGIEYLWMVNDESEIDDISAQINIQLSQPASELLPTTATVPPPRQFSYLPLPLPPLASELFNINHADEILNAINLNRDIRRRNNENLVLQTAANLNMLEDNNNIRLSELIKQFSTRTTGESHVLNFTNYSLSQEHIPQRLMHIVKQLEVMSLSFNKYLILLILLTHYFEWIFNEKNAPTIPVEHYDHFSFTMFAYCAGTLLNGSVFRKAESRTLFWASYCMIMLMVVRNYLILYTSNTVLPYLISAVYPPIIINLCRIYFANLRIYAHPDYKFRFRVEKFFLFYGYNLLSVLSAFLIFRKEETYVNTVIIAGSIATVCILFRIIYQSYHVLLNVIYRSTKKELFNVP